jgi:hypothetical protein
MTDNTSKTELRDRVLRECALFDAHHVWMDTESIDDDTLPLLTESLLATYGDSMNLGARLRFLAAIRRHIALPSDLRHAMSSTSDSESNDETSRPAVAATVVKSSPVQPQQSTPPTRFRRFWNGFIWFLCLPFRAIRECLRLFLRGLWHFAAVWATLTVYVVVGVFGGLSLYKDLSAYRFGFGNIAVFGSWYILIGLFALSLLFSLVWVHSIWVYFVLGQPNFIFGDPQELANDKRQAVGTKKDQPRPKQTKHE